MATTDGEECKKEDEEGIRFSDIPLQSFGSFCCDSASSSTLCSSKQTDSPSDVQEFIVRSEEDEEGYADLLLVLDASGYLVSSSGNFWDEVWELDGEEAGGSNRRECEDDVSSRFTEVDDWLAWGGAAEAAVDLHSDLSLDGC